MNPQCPKCEGEMKYVAPGVSKAGKPYPGFYSCKVFTCDGTFNPPKNAVQGPSQGNYGKDTQSLNQPPFTPPQAPSASTELLTEIRDLLKSIDKKILLRDPETGEIIPF